MIGNTPHTQHHHSHIHTFIRTFYFPFTQTDAKLCFAAVATKIKYRLIGTMKHGSLIVTIDREKSHRRHHSWIVSRLLLLLFLTFPLSLSYLSYLGSQW